MDRFSEYRIMWVLVFFDLPTETKKDKKAEKADNKKAENKADNKADDVKEEENK